MKWKRCIGQGGEEFPPPPPSMSTFPSLEAPHHSFPLPCPHGAFTPLTAPSWDTLLPSVTPHALVGFLLLWPFSLCLLWWIFSFCPAFNLRISQVLIWDHLVFSFTSLWEISPTSMDSNTIHRETTPKLMSVGKTALLSSALTQAARVHSTCYPSPCTSPSPPPHPVSTLTVLRWMTVTALRGLSASTPMSFALSR